MPKGEKLTIKQRRFVKEYVKDGNGTEAVIKAGYNVKDRHVAENIADQNLDKPLIRQAIDQALIDLEITPHWILSKHKKLITQNEEHLNPQNQMVVSRNLESLGKIGGLYPSQKTDLELSDGKLKISWE